MNKSKELRASPKNRIATRFLQLVVVLIGMGALAFMLWEPHLEGRNVNATPWEIYFNDPFLAFAYIASMAFFVALYQAYKVLGFAGREKLFSPEAVTALRTMKSAALALLGFVAVGEVYIVFSQTDDRAGGVMMGLLIGFSSLVLAAAAATGEQILQSVAKSS